MSDDRQEQREGAEVLSQNIQVVLRLRPMNKLEASRRSKNCIELHEDPCSLTVDSPLEGEYDFTFDHVLEEYATQNEVYQHSVHSVASSLMQGFSCTVISYGQTGSGKSLTMLGDAANEGMIPRMSRALFDSIQKNIDGVHTEYSIKCCFVEIYLEKVLDLLLPGGTEDSSSVSISSTGEIVGAAELCCVDEEDIQNVLSRGSANRTQSSLELGTDSSRSHAIFVLTLVQRNGPTETTARLLVCDLAGSELASPQRTNDVMGAVQTEAIMVNKSLVELHKLVKSRLPTAASRSEGTLVAAPSNTTRQCKLTRLLAGSFGGNTMTTVILTASPSSYNIGETINTIKFGQKCRRITNQPRVNRSTATVALQQQLEEKQDKLRGLLHLAKELSLEYSAFTAETGDDESRKGPLWDNVNALLTWDEKDDEDDLEVIVLPRGQGETTGGEQARSDLEQQLAELRSEVAVLRTQNEELTADRKRDAGELMHAKNEIHQLTQRKTEVEHNLRTSQFRENEAIVFLRQFRRFYRNVLRDKARHGSGSLQKIAEEIGQIASNAPDLNQLTDVDALMLESGLIEDYELNDDRSSGTYAPSKAALVRSAAAAEKAALQSEELRAEKRENNEIDDDGSSYVTSSSVRSSIRRIGTLNVNTDDGKESVSEMGDGGISQYAREETIDGVRSNSDASSIGERDTDGPDAGAGAGSASTGTDKESSRGRDGGDVIAAQAKLLMTPSGRLTTMREKELEKELSEMSERCVDLQMALKEERATVEALTSRSGGLSKKKLAQEAIALRQQLEKMNENLMAIAWKMNELNLINKSYNEKMVNREQHVIYLEENLVDLQNTNRRIVVDRQEAEKKLREEVESLRNVVDGMALPLWQFGQRDVAVKPSINRIVITLGGGPNTLVTSLNQSRERRLSGGGPEPDLDLVSVDSITEIGSKEVMTQTDRLTALETTDAEIQTEQPVETADAKMQTDDAVGANELEGVHALETERPDQLQSTHDVHDPLVVRAAEAPPVLANDTAGIRSSSGDERSSCSISEGETRERKGLMGLVAGTTVAAAAAAGGVVAATTGSSSNDSLRDASTQPAFEGTEMKSIPAMPTSSAPVRLEESVGRLPSMERVDCDGSDRNSVSSESEGETERELAQGSNYPGLKPSGSSDSDDELFESGKRIVHQDEEAIATMGMSNDKVHPDHPSHDQVEPEHVSNASCQNVEPSDAARKAPSSSALDSDSDPSSEAVIAAATHSMDTGDSVVAGEKQEIFAEAKRDPETSPEAPESSRDYPAAADGLFSGRLLTVQMLEGGRSNDFVPRRFADKRGSRIKPGIVRDGKSSRGSARRKSEDNGSRKIAGHKDKKEKKKKKKSSDPDKKRKESKRKSRGKDERKRSDRDSSHPRSNADPDSFP